MKFTGIPYKKIFKFGKAYFEKHAADILTGAVCAGVIGTGILTYKGTLKAEEYLNSINLNSKSDDEKKIEKVKSLRFFVPPAIAATATVICAIGANAINHKKIAAFAAVCTLAENAINEKDAKITELLGEKNLKLINDGIAQDKIEKIENAVSAKEIAICDSGHGDIKCVEILKTGMVILASPEWVLKCVNDLNYEINSCESASYARFIELLTRDCREDIFIPDELYEIGYNKNKTGLMEIETYWSGNPTANERYMIIKPINRPIVSYMTEY